MTHDREEALTLALLDAIEARSDLTQRHLADRLGVALGLANSYLKRCVRKGWVKITQTPINRYLYYLTLMPQGFSETSRLTGSTCRCLSIFVAARATRCAPCLRSVWSRAIVK